MSEQCVRILTLFKHKDKTLDFRRLLMMIDRHYWDDFLNDRNQINNYINQLIKDEFILLDTVSDSDGRQWKGYRITDKGTDYLSQIKDQTI